MFFQIIIILAVVSFLWAVWSLRDIKKDTKAIKGVQKELETGRVVFHHEHAAKHYDSSSSSSEV